MQLSKYRINGEVMKRGKYLAKNTLLFALNVVGTKLITFLLVPLYTGAFSTTEYGVVDLINTIAVILVPVITLNIGEAIMRFGLDKDVEKNDISTVGILFAFLSLGIGLIVFPILKLFSSINIDYSLVYLFCVSQGLYITFSYNLRGQEKLIQYAIGNIICTFLMAILNIVFLVVLKCGVKGYFYAYIISYIISTLYCVISGDVLKVFNAFSVKRDLIKKMVKYSIVLVPNSFMWWIMNSSDHIMVTAMINISANGIYAISYRIPSITAAFSQVFNQAWSYSAISEDKSADRTEFYNDMFDKFVCFQFFLTTCLILVIKPFLRIYVSQAYYEAWKYTPYLLIGYFFSSLGTFLSTSYTVSKDSKGFLVSGTMGAVINIFLNGLLIPIIGIHGAAFATCVSYIVVFLYRYYDIKKYVVINVWSGKYIKFYMMLIAVAFSMFIPEKKGNIILLIELIIAVLLDYGFIMECVKLVKVLLIKIRR